MNLNFESQLREVKLPASELSLLPMKVLSYYWKQKKGKAIVTLVLVGGILSLWRVGSMRQRYQETLISQHLDPKRQFKRLDFTKFQTQLRKLRSLCVPQFFCKETYHCILLTVLLLSRSYLSIVIADVISSNAQALVDRQLYQCIFGLTQLGILAIPTAIVNSALKYCTSTLSIYIRKRLTLFCHEFYLDSNNTFYKSLQFYPNENLGARITQDIDRFSVALSSFYASSFKSLMDIILLSMKLSKTTGVRGPVLMLLYYFITGLFIRLIMPSFSKLYTAQQRVEDNFRTSHAKLLNNAEEIAFFHSGEREKTKLNQTYDQLFRNTGNIIRLRAIVNAIDGWLTKYGATVMGFVLCAISIFDKKNATKSSSDLTKDIVLNMQLFIHFSATVNQIVLLYKKSLNLSDCTSKVDNLLTKLQTLHRSFIPQSSPPLSFPKSQTAAAVENDDEEDEDERRKRAKRCRKHRKSSTNDASSSITSPNRESDDVKGEEKEGEEKDSLSSESDDENDVGDGDSDSCDSDCDFEDDDGDDDDCNDKKKNFGDIISFENVSVKTSNRVLFENLSFSVKAGNNLLISGPSGCGKTTILRLLSGLIPVGSGTILKPFGGFKELYFLPQKSYLFEGSLRDQIIYPHNQQDMISNGKDDSLLYQILEQLQLSYLVQNTNLDCVNDWEQVLNDTEKQLLSVARLYYHKPRFAILDECLYNISVEAEEKIYQTLSDMSVTLISVSNRKSVRQFHKKLLHLTGFNGMWNLSSLQSNERFSHI